MDDPKKAILETISTDWSKAPHAEVWAFNQSALLKRIFDQLDPQTPADIVAINYAWHELYRNGVIGWGWDPRQRGGANCQDAFMTPHGNTVIKAFTRDPENPAGYLAHISVAIEANSIAGSYVEEALKTYATGCNRAAVVLIGCAAESLLREMRDQIVSKYVSAGKPQPSDIKTSVWMAKAIATGVEKILDDAKLQMPKELGDDYNGRWASLYDVIRKARNDAGHPNAVGSLGRSDVHAILLLFPETAKLMRALIQWVDSSFKPK